MMNGDSDKSIDTYNSSLEPSNHEHQSTISCNRKDSSTGKAELVWQQGNLQAAISLYDKAIKENPHSVEPYQQLFTHLKQQNSVAEAYKKLAESLKEQGNNEEAANCYRQAVIIQAVIKEVTAKYKGNIPNSQSNFVSNVANLKENAFSFQGAIKEGEKNGLWQMSLSQEQVLDFDSTSTIKKLDSQKIATVEWETAQIFMQKALEHCDREQWSEVAKACSEATSVMPKMAEAYKIWGNALQRMNRTAEAMEYYGKAVEIQPDLAEVYAGIAQLYAQQQKWQQAIEYYQKAIIIKPGFPRAYRSLASVWEQCGQWKKAQICLQRAKELDKEINPNSAKKNSSQNNGKKNQQKSLRKVSSDKAVDDSIFTCHQLAKDFEQQHLWQEAAVYYRQALELNLTQQLVNSEVVEGEEYRLIQLARLRKIQKLVASSNGSTDDKETLAKNVLLTSNKSKTTKSQNLDSALEQAIGKYHRQAKLQPNSADIQINLGDLYARKKRWSSAIACYKKAVRIDPREATAHMKLAKAAAKSGNNSSHLDHMYLAYTLKPSLGSAEDHFLLGEALKKAGNRTRAISCYEQAIKLQPHFNEAYRCLGRIFQETGRQRNALACYQAAIRHNPQDAEFQFSLGELQEKQGSWEDAVKAFSRVLEIQPKYPQASQKLNHALSEKLKQDLVVKYKR